MRGTCVLQTCKHHAMLRKRGARDLSSTSPEPYHGNGTGTDWLTGIPFVRQQAPGAFYLCPGAVYPFLPLVWPEGQPFRSERRAKRTRASGRSFLGYPSVSKSALHCFVF